MPASQDALRNDLEAQLDSYGGIDGLSVDSIYEVLLEACHAGLNQMYLMEHSGVEALALPARLRVASSPHGNDATEPPVQRPLQVIARQ